MGNCWTNGIASDATGLAYVLFLGFNMIKGSYRMNNRLLVLFNLEILYVINQALDVLVRDDLLRGRDLGGDDRSSHSGYCWYVL